MLEGRACDQGRDRRDRGRCSDSGAEQLISEATAKNGKASVPAAPASLQTVSDRAARRGSRLEYPYEPRPGVLPLGVRGPRVGRASFLGK